MRVLFFILCFASSLALFAQNNKDSLIVFVGEKIDVQQMPDRNKKDSPAIYMDSEYKASYKILKLLNGHYTADTISFYAYDHYGTPAFSNYKTVLLFVYPYSNGNTHEKYQFFPVYKTTDDRWAGAYASGDYQNSYFKANITVEPEKINFKENVSFDLEKLDSERIEYFYPAPFFTIKKKKAIPVYGNYIEDLFRIKQQTYLRRFGY